MFRVAQYYRKPLFSGEKDNKSTRIITYNGLTDTLGGLVLRYNPQRVFLLIKNLDFLYKIAVDFNSPPEVISGNLIKGVLVSPSPDIGLKFGYSETGINELYIKAYYGTPRYHILEGVID